MPSLGTVALIAVAPLVPLPTEAVSAVVLVAAVKTTGDSTATVVGLLPVNGLAFSPS